MASKAEQRSDAMKVLRNPEDHSKAEIAKAKKVIADYDAIQGGDMAVAITVGVLPKSKKKMLQKMLVTTNEDNKDKPWERSGRLTIFVNKDRPCNVKLLCKLSKIE